MTKREKFSPYVADLPPELTREIKRKTSLELKMMEVFMEGGGKLNVNESLVGFYRLHGEVKTRRDINAILQRLVNKGTLKRAGKKGEFETRETQKND